MPDATNLFHDLPARIAGIQLHPPSVIHMVVLQKIESPVLSTSADQPLNADPFDTMRAIYVLSLDDEDLMRYFDSFSREEFDAGVKRFSRSTPMLAVPALLETAAKLLVGAQRSDAPAASQTGDAPASKPKKGSR